MSAPKNVRLRYIGGIPLTVHLHTGRTVEVKPGEVYEFLPAEAEVLSDHPDYEPEAAAPVKPEEA